IRAISSFSLEEGTSSFCWCARIALRTRVRKSATGSVKFICTFSLPVYSGTPEDLTAISLSFEFRVPSFESLRLKAARNSKITTQNCSCYQLDFETPGISPRSANWRKHKRQMPKRRRKARGRPHRLQRLWRRLEKI